MLANPSDFLAPLSTIRVEFQLQSLPIHDIYQK